MVRQLNMHLRVEETGKQQWFKEQILKYDPTSGQYGVSSHLTRMSSAWTSCSLCTSCSLSQHFVATYSLHDRKLQFRSYVQSNSQQREHQRDYYREGQQPRSRGKESHTEDSKHISLCYKALSKPSWSEVHLTGNFVSSWKIMMILASPKSFICTLFLLLSKHIHGFQTTMLWCKHHSSRYQLWWKETAYYWKG